ncbi:MAG: hypothetical protein AB1758_00840, partial [Candidatus Eremiobacterota bacterium]
MRTVVTWRPAGAAPLAASGSPDRAELTGHAGVPALSATMQELQALKGDLSAGLTPNLKGRLEPVFRQLHRSGVRFYAERGSLFGGRKHELDPHQLLDHLTKCPSHYLERLSVKVPGSEEFLLEGIGSLAALEPLVLGPDDAVKQAFRGLAAAGYDKDVAQSYLKAVAHGQLSIQFYRGGMNKFGDNLETYCTTNLDEVLTVGHFAGGSSLDFVEHADRARRLDAAHQEGWLAHDDYLPVYRARDERIPLKVDPKLPPLKVDEDFLDDLPRARAEAARYQAAYRRYVLPVVSAAGASGSLTLHDELHSPDGALPLEARLESFAILASSARYALAKEVQQLHQDLCHDCPSAVELNRRATLLASVLKEGDLEAARNALKDLTPIAAQDPKAALYEELRVATDSHPVAQAGVNLVRIPVFCEGVGPQDLETRKAAYTRVAIALSDADRDHAPQVYQELLIHR